MPVTGLHYIPFMTHGSVLVLIRLYSHFIVKYVVTCREVTSEGMSLEHAYYTGFIVMGSFALVMSICFLFVCGLILCCSWTFIFI